MQKQERKIKTDIQVTSFLKVECMCCWLLIKQQIKCRAQGIVV